MSPYTPVQVYVIDEHITINLLVDQLGKVENKHIFQL